jgi:hypothetical protein
MLAIKILHQGLMKRIAWLEISYTVMFMYNRKLIVIDLSEEACLQRTLSSAHTH